MTGVSKPLRTASVNGATLYWVTSPRYSTPTSLGSARHLADQAAELFGKEQIRSEDVEKLRTH